MMSKRLCDCALVALLAIVGCDDAGGGGGGPTGEGEGEGPGEGEGEGETCDGANRVVPARPAGFASLWLHIDDTAAKTYGANQLKWNGSFLWEEATNVVTYESNWLPERGGYPLLWDDGPMSCGGHEAEGQTATDNVWSAEVWVDARDAEATFEYGVINERDNWIWVGANGEVTVPEGSADRIEAPGLTIPGFGTFDLKLTLDHADLDPLIYENNEMPAVPEVYLKGTMSSWANILLFDDGQQGDEVAGDGVFSYVQSERLGGHEGLLSAGQAAQFVWVHLFVPDGDPKDVGREYKVAGAASLPEGVPRLDEVDPERSAFEYASPVGVKAWTRPRGGDWREEPIQLGLESRGVTWNTTIVVSAEGEGEGEGEGPAEGEGEGPAEGEGEGPAEGEGEGPAEGEGEGSGAVEILLVDPGFGPMAGGTRLTITGSGFGAGATVEVGGAAATDVVVDGLDRIDCTTPAHAAGAVDVVVRVGGDTARLPRAFTYREEGGGGIDLTIDGDLSDWDVSWPRTSSERVSDWGDNVLRELRAVTDGTTLWVAVNGNVEPDNVIVGYVDVDAGAGTGVTDLNGLSDNDGGLDAAISSALTIAEAGMGAELAFGSKGMAGAAGLESNAGWRSLSPADNFGWLAGPLAVSNGTIETSVALPEVHGNRIAIAVRIFNAEGAFTSNQSLPEDAAGAIWATSLVVEVPGE